MTAWRRLCAAMDEAESQLRRATKAHGEFGHKAEVALAYARGYQMATQDAMQYQHPELEIVRRALDQDTAV